MRLISGALAYRSRIFRDFKKISQETIPRSLTTRPRYHNISRSLKGPRIIHNSYLLQPVNPICMPSNGYFNILRVAGTAVLKLSKLRYIFLVGGAAGGASIYQTIEGWKEKFSGANAFISDVKNLLPKDLPKLSELSDWMTSNVAGEGKLLDVDGFYKFLVAKAAKASKLANTIVAAEVAERRKAKEVAEEEEAVETADGKTPETNEETPTEMAGEKVLTEEELKKLEDDLRDQIILEQQQYQEKLEELMEENRELRSKMMLRKGAAKERKIKYSTTDMYSNVLDELASYNRDNNIQDHLPRVVVVGDQSAGKTSVLEMIAQARIFPRGGGEMMTRSPVKVTMSQGLHHVAAFNDSQREYDLTKEEELKALRKEIENRMKHSVKDGQTISNETISLTVKGPGLRRMVLVDLPGVISTVTTGMASDTRTRIRDVCKSHMENPNAIILCIQDGSIDAEKSIVTELVSSMDPTGERTIFVMTKVDVMENNKFNPDRVKRIMEGKLFPMKALGYFAVVTGKSNSEDGIEAIKKYEREFFQSSALLKNGVLKPGQLTTDNLSRAVSDCFWKMVQDSVQEEAQNLRAASINLQTEWDYKFPKHRKMDREEIFTKAVGEILDEVVNTSRMSDEHWETTFRKKVWERIGDDIFNIYLKASASEKQADFNITMDRELRKFAEKSLPLLCMEVGEDTIRSEFKKNLFAEKRSKDPLLDRIKNEVSDQRHTWNERAEQSLRMFALETLRDKSLEAEEKQTSSFEFMETVVKEKLSRAEKEFQDLIGPGKVEMWTYWRSRTPEQSNRRHTVAELEKLINGKNKPSALDKDQLTALRKNLELQSVTVSDDFIQETWSHLTEMSLLRRALSMSRETHSEGYFGGYWGGPSDTKLPNDLLFFKKIEKMLGETSRILRQQLVKDEVYRFEKKVKDLLDEIADDEQKLKSLLQDNRVEIVEKLKHVKQIQELLDQFIKALNREKA